MFTSFSQRPNEVFRQKYLSIEQKRFSDFLFKIDSKNAM